MSAICVLNGGTTQVIVYYGELYAFCQFANSIEVWDGWGDIQNK